MTLAIVVGAALSTLVHPVFSASQIGTNPAVVLLIVVAMLGISRVIKFVILSQTGGSVHLGYSTFSIGWRTESTWRYMDVFSSDTFLTRHEFTRITLVPHAVSLLIIAILLAFVPPVLQFAAIVGFAVKAPDVLVPLLNLRVARRCPPGSLFVESDGGVLDVYRAG